VFRVAVTDGQRPGDLFVPMHWTEQRSSGGRTGLLPGKDRDALSGQPGFKNTPATASPVTPDWTGFLVTQDDPAVTGLLYHTKVRTAAGWLVELAGMGDPAVALDLLPAGDRAEVVDGRRGSIRAAVLADGRLRAALFITRDNSLPPRDWLIAQLAAMDGSSIEVLAGRPATPAPDRGPVICVCFDVGLNTIIDAIASQSLTSVEAVGAAIYAGTNCGSCRPAIAKLLLVEKEVAHA
jgi:assimilatory nitrate reductase catalytic subunit